MYVPNIAPAPMPAAFKPSTNTGRSGFALVITAIALTALSMYVK